MTNNHLLNSYSKDYKMCRTFILLCLLFTGISWSSAQNGFTPAYPLELGVQIGSAQFLGDLGGQSGKGRAFIRDTDLKAIRPTFGIFGRYNMGGHFSARVDANFLMLAGDDAWSGNSSTGFNAEGPRSNVDDSWFRSYRNLHFRSRVWELAVAGEIIPYNFELGGGYQGYSVLSPYATIGVGLFYFNPQALYNGQWVDLQPLSTEGQDLVDGRVAYNRLQLNVPMGLGVKWMYEDIWALCLEVNHRLTFTDYIDDVSTDYINPQIFEDNFNNEKAAMATAMARRSVELDPGLINGVVSDPGQQRGDPKDNDSYYTISLRFSFFIDQGSFGGGGGRMGCPVW